MKYSRSHVHFGIFMPDNFTAFKRIVEFVIDDG